MHLPRCSHTAARDLFHLLQRVDSLAKTLRLTQFEGQIAQGLNTFFPETGVCRAGELEQLFRQLLEPGATTLDSTTDWRHQLHAGRDMELKAILTQGLALIRAYRELPVLMHHHLETPEGVLGHDPHAYPHEGRGIEAIATPGRGPWS